MAAVRVFVDDAILGRLPMVCARTGRPADVVISSTRPVGGGLGALHAAERQGAGPAMAGGR